jgi:hypothetical protein
MTMILSYAHRYDRHQRDLTALKHLYQELQLARSPVLQDLADTLERLHEGLEATFPELPKPHSTEIDPETKFCPVETELKNALRHF